MPTVVFWKAAQNLFWRQLTSQSAAQATRRRTTLLILGIGLNLSHNTTLRRTSDYPTNHSHATNAEKQVHQIHIVGRPSICIANHEVIAALCSTVSRTGCSFRGGEARFLLCQNTLFAVCQSVLQAHSRRGHLLDALIQLILTILTCGWKHVIMYFLPPCYTKS